MPSPRPLPCPPPASRAPSWAPWLLLAWALFSLLALIWLDWNAALRGVLCFPRS
jgi:hypothetical protein